MEIRIDVSHSERSFHMALFVTFENLKDYKIYDKHPAHGKVKEYVFNVMTDIAVVDYNI